MMLNSNKQTTLLTLAIIFSFGLVWGCKQFHLLRLVRIDSRSNEPTLHDGGLYIGSSISNPSFLDFCIFENITQRNNPIWIFRVCGIPGDTIQIKEGILYVNKVNVDMSLKLAHVYKIREMDTVDLGLEKFESLPISNSDTLLVNLSDVSVIERQLSAIKYILPEDSSDRNIKRVFNENWNRDNFGPIVVPDSSFFLLGDNRNDALDSRMIGFVKRSNIHGCLLFRR